MHSTFPPELWHLILQYVDDSSSYSERKRTLFQFITSCRLFYSLGIPHLWRDIHLTRNIAADSKRFKYTRSIEVDPSYCPRYERSNTLVTVIKNCPNLSSLSLDSISISNLDLITDKVMGQKLKRFAMTNSFIHKSHFMNNLFALVLKAGARLEQLDLSNTNFNIDPTSVLSTLASSENEGPRNTTLTKLNLSQCFLLKSDALLFMINRLPKLKHLDISNCRFIKTVAINECVKRLGASLKHLNLYSTNINHETFKVIGAYCPNLKTLIVGSSIQSCWDEDLIHIKHCELLTHLEVHDCPNVTVQSISQIVQKCRQLKHLDISGTSVLGGEYIDELLPFMSNVQTLRITESPVSQEKVMDIIKQLPNLLQFDSQYRSIDRAELKQLRKLSC